MTKAGYPTSIPGQGAKCKIEWLGWLSDGVECDVKLAML